MIERRAIRTIAAAIALLWAAVPLASAIHGAVESHEYCLEHNAFEHAGATHDHDHGDGADDLLHAEEQDAEHGHAPCAFGDACFRAALVVAASDAPVTAPARPAPQPAVASQTDAPVVPVLAVAPKSSPPVS